MNSYRSIQIVLLVLGVAAAPAIAAPEDTDPDAAPQFGAAEPRQPFDFTDAVDDRHARLSSRVMRLGRQLDRFFGGQQYARETKASELRLGVTSLLTGDDLEFDSRIRLRLALPNTERRLSLVLESAEDDLFSPADPDRPPRARRSIDEGGDYFAGVRYVRRLADDWGIDSDAGVKLRLPPDPYARVRGGRSWFVQLWEARLSQSLFWRESEGQGATTELRLQRALAGPQFLQAVSQATWLDREQRFFYSQDVVISHSFSELNAIQLRLGVRGESQPSTRVTTYYMNLPWRRDIYRRWLFIELRPELLFEEETDFQVQPRFLIGLEAFFGEKHYPEPAELEPEMLPRLLP